MIWSWLLSHFLAAGFAVVVALVLVSVSPHEKLPPEI